ncbi:MAG: hypothetical protein GW903_02590 [Alphaproteobacteria bacterium]|nr:hypothetical protein [Alphaproteobacteria bacterium]NCQ87861.1 hypothetical protein [Alphaproteobacteria bacterium]NCT05631.1 hypothetical protein [Alphaproteobacteria bacterium]
MAKPLTDKEVNEQYERYENPQNGYEEIVSGLDVFLALILGPIFFLSKNIWNWALIISAIQSLILFFVATNIFEGVVIMSIVYLTLTVMTKSILRIHYKRMGWNQKLPLPTESKAINLFLAVTKNMTNS